MLVRHLWPKRVLWLQSNPWAFQTAQMNDLEFQSVLYATYHTRGFSQITHLSIAPDQFAWFMLLFLWSPWAVAVAMAGLTFQAFRLREPTLSAPLILAWVGLAARGGDASAHGRGLDSHDWPHGGAAATRLRGHGKSFHTASEVAHLLTRARGGKCGGVHLGILFRPAVAVRSGANVVARQIGRAHV